MKFLDHLKTEDHTQNMETHTEVLMPSEADVAS